MRKRIHAFKLQVLYGLSMIILLCGSSVPSFAEGFESFESVKKESEKLRWLGGTTLDGVELISLDWNVIEQPDDPMVGDSICFGYTATNLSEDDTLKNVMIVHNDVLIAMGACLLPNGQMADMGVNTNTGSGTYVLTGSLCSVLTQTDIDNGFVLQAPVSAFGTVGTGGPPVADCQDPIACFGVTLACTDYNISLDQECETLLTADLLKINSKVPDSLLRIRIQEPNGDFRPIPMVGPDDVGTQVKVVVDIPGCSEVAPCWSFANIEYKFGPAQICTVDTVTCAQQVAMNDPIITFACGATQFIRSETIREDLCKVSSDFIAKETTTFAVQDQFGNISDTCVQVRYILKPNLQDTGEILWPPLQTVLSCEEQIFAEDGSILPLFSGVPKWVSGRDTLDLTDRDLPASCNVFTEFEDLIQLDRNCEKRIIRRWTVSEWLCQGGVMSFERLQTIILRDTTPPEITVQAPVFDLTVNEVTCSAMFDVPRPTVTDNCQPDSTIEVEIRYPGGSSILNPDLNTISIPFGDGNIIEYIARDRCGNESRDTSIVNVVDNTTPVAICLRELVISISDTSVTMPVEKFDEDSYDACGIDRITVRKMFNTCSDTDTEESDAVTFCCAEGESEVPVILRVYDMSGNFNECMIMVDVQDKSNAAVTCLPDIYVSCDFEFDPNSDLTGFFGTIDDNSTVVVPIEVPREFLVDSSGPLVNGNFVDNCGASIEELPAIVDIDSICRTGTVLRTFVITDNSGVQQRCEQLISIVGDQQNNPLEFEFFPEDETIVAVDPDDVRQLAIDNPPVVRNTGCSLIGIGFTDQVFRLDSIYCTKILRTWQVIDWCRNPTGLVELDSVQTIFVIDNDAPEIVLNTNVTVPEPLPGDFVELVATATDNVVANPKFLDWSYEAFSGNSNTPFSSGEFTFADFRGSSVVLKLPDLTEGSYTINWFAMDKCNNTDTAVQQLTIVERVSGDDMANVVGQVLFSRGGEMDNVGVFLTDRPSDYNDALNTATDINGDYAFANMPLGGQYFIDPEKNDDPLNGVSTLDLILIQRHILGLSQLESASDLFAADINADGSISALDLVELRRLLLGYQANFQQKDSWTFLHEEQDIESAIMGGLPLEEEYHIQYLQENMDIAFIGIKTGDVSGDARAHSALAETRSKSTVVWSMREKDLAGGKVEVSFYASKHLSAYGFQAAFNIPEGLDLESTKAGAFELEEDNFNRSLIAENGTLPISYSTAESIDIQEGDVLFSLIFNKSGDNSASIGLNERNLRNELYTIDGLVHAINVQEEEILDEVQLVLKQNIPNPWSERTLIEAIVPNTGIATLRVYDLHNRLIYEQAQSVNAGKNTIEISNEQVQTSGLYFYELEIGGFIERQKMIRVN